MVPPKPKVKAVFRGVDERFSGRHNQYIYSVMFDVVDKSDHDKVLVQGESVEVRVPADSTDPTSQAKASASRLVRIKLKNYQSSGGSTTSIDEGALAAAINKVSLGE